MKIQLALDRFSIEEAIALGRKARDSVDWIEVGTSLIKEFGVASIRAVKEAFPDKTIVADIKTNDNAVYEAELCFETGADVMTVMGSAATATIKACFETAARYKKQVMIDLLNLDDEQKRGLLQFEAAIFCEHVSKDEQEMGGKKNERGQSVFSGKRIAVAGGINEDTLPMISRMDPEVVIVGSAITKAADPAEAAARLKKLSAEV